MRITKKYLLLTAAASIILGGAIFTAAGCSVGWDFTKIGTANYQTSTHVLDETFQNISIDTTTVDVCFLPSDDANAKVICKEEVKLPHVVTVENGTLTIKETYEKSWYDNISFGAGNTSVTVYLPQSTYANLSIDISTGDIAIPQGFTFDSIDIQGTTCDVECYASTTNTLTVKVSTGDIKLENASVGSLSLTASTGDMEITGVTVANDFTHSVTTGDTKMSNVACKNFTSTGNTGALTMENLITTEKMKIERSTGDVTFEGCDAGEILVETSTGDVTGTLLTTKNFHASSSSGEVKVPDSTTGGTCKITCSTGDIKITVIEN